MTTSPLQTRIGTMLSRIIPRFLPAVGAGVGIAVALGMGDLDPSHASVPTMPVSTRVTSPARSSALNRLIQRLQCRSVLRLRQLSRADRVWIICMSSSRCSRCIITSMDRDTGIVLVPGIRTILTITTTTTIIITTTIIRIISGIWR